MPSVLTAPVEVVNETSYPEQAETSRYLEEVGFPHPFLVAFPWKGSSRRAIVFESGDQAVMREELERMYSGQLPLISQRYTELDDAFLLALRRNCGDEAVLFLAQAITAAVLKQGALDGNRLVYTRAPSGYLGREYVPVSLQTNFERLFLGIIWGIKTCEGEVCRHLLAERQLHALYASYYDGRGAGTIAFDKLAALVVRLVEVTERGAPKRPRRQRNGEEPLFVALCRDRLLVAGHD